MCGHIIEACAGCRCGRRGRRGQPQAPFLTPSSAGHGSPHSHGHALMRCLLCALLVLPLAAAAQLLPEGVARETYGRRTGDARETYGRSGRGGEPGAGCAPGGGAEGRRLLPQLMADWSEDWAMDGWDGGGGALLPQRWWGQGFLHRAKVCAQALVRSATTERTQSGRRSGKGADAERTQSGRWADAERKRTQQNDGGSAPKGGRISESQ